jgi:hypothetical protein
VFAEYFAAAYFTTVACGAVLLFHALYGFAAALKSEKLYACLLKRYYRFPVRCNDICHYKILLFYLAGFLNVVVFCN